MNSNHRDSSGIEMWERVLWGLGFLAAVAAWRAWNAPMRPLWFGEAPFLGALAVAVYRRPARRSAIGAVAWVAAAGAWVAVDAIVAREAPRLSWMGLVVALIFVGTLLGMSGSSLKLFGRWAPSPVRQIALASAVSLFCIPLALFLSIYASMILAGEGL